MRVQGEPQVQVLINETGCVCDGPKLLRFLNLAYDTFSEIVDLFEEQFF